MFFPRPFHKYIVDVMAENKQHKRKERRSSGGARGLEEKVNVMMGGQSGLALEIDPKTPIDSNSRRMTHGGIYGQRRRAVPSNSHARIFPTPRSSHSYLQKDTPARSVAMSTNSRLSRFSRASTANPSGNRNRMQNSTAAVHIVCAISENLAQETCVASVDAGSPISVHVTKQGNGQTYAETMAYLEVLKPDEVLLNEGRRNSQLARKIMDLFNVNSDPVVEPPLERSRHRHRDDYVYNIHEQNDPPEVSTVVKFISRAYFDQTRGAELLRKIVREDSYDATLVEEYILLSSSHAVLHYVQHCLGANFLNNSVHLSINSGGNNRMEIDRSTMLQLELLMNSKTGKVKDSLIGMMDSTKTTVGSRLLRTNLMSPPTRTDTINTRLELVDLILSNADFFYSILEHLSDLPDVDKMLSNVALVPRIHTTEKGPMSTKSQDRIASRGISALVCIKTALQSLPSFATSLGNHLLSLDECDQDGAATFNDDTTIATDRSTLLIGLGGATRGFLSNDTRHHRLLRAIIFALTQPRLSTVLESVTGIFTESTTFSRNANVMRHQVCFAFKSEEKSIMSVIRKAYLAHVDNIYRKADEYAEVHGFSVTVRYSKSRGYYLAVPLDAGTTLPQVFSQPSKSGRYITCTTLEIASLNARAQDNVHDLLKMTQGRIEEVMNVARANYDAIATVCDAIAILDMCHSFADNVLTQT